jgi:integrase/recombinase XerD
MEAIKLHQFKEKMRLFGYAERTAREYAEEVGRFFKYLEENEDMKTLSDLTVEQVKAWHAYLTFKKSERNKRLLAGGTVLNRLQAVKTFFRIMYRENLCPHDYTSFIVLPKTQKPLPRNVPDVVCVRKLLQAIEPAGLLGVRNRFMLELMYATGIRSQELRQLTLYRLNVQERTLHVTGKGSKDRIVPMGEWVTPYALEYLHAARPRLARRTENDVLFLSRNGWPLTKNNLNWIIDTYRVKAGLTMRITAHALRHACATHMIQAGADIRYVQELLGHEDLGSTQIYTRVTIGDLKKAHLKYHPANRDDFQDGPDGG